MQMIDAVPNEIKGSLVGLTEIAMFRDATRGELIWELDAGDLGYVGILAESDLSAGSVGPVMHDANTMALLQEVL